jgi:hypothetical protein
VRRGNPVIRRSAFASEGICRATGDDQPAVCREWPRLMDITELVFLAVIGVVALVRIVTA